MTLPDDQWLREAFAKDATPRPQPSVEKKLMHQASLTVQDMAPAPSARRRARHSPVPWILAAVSAAALIGILLANRWQPARPPLAENPVNPALAEADEQSDPRALCDLFFGFGRLYWLQKAAIVEILPGADLPDLRPAGFLDLRGYRLIDVWPDHLLLGKEGGCYRVQPGDAKPVIYAIPENEPFTSTAFRAAAGVFETRLTGATMDRVTMDSSKTLDETVRMLGDIAEIELRVSSRVTDTTSPNLSLQNVNTMVIISTIAKLRGLQLAADPRAMLQRDATSFPLLLLTAGELPDNHDNYAGTLCLPLRTLARITGETSEELAAQCDAFFDAAMVRYPCHESSVTSCRYDVNSQALSIQPLWEPETRFLLNSIRLPRTGAADDAQAMNASVERLKAIRLKSLRIAGTCSEFISFFSEATGENFVVHESLLGNPVDREIHAAEESVTAHECLLRWLAESNTVAAWQDGVWLLLALKPDAAGIRLDNPSIPHLIRVSTLDAKNPKIRDDILACIEAMRVDPLLKTITAGWSDQYAASYAACFSVFGGRVLALLPPEYIATPPSTTLMLEFVERRLTMTPNDFAGWQASPERRIVFLFP